MADTRRTAVVTGAGSGIGRATCVQLSLRGYAVACLDLRGEAAGETATTIRDAGGEAWAVPVDVGVEPEVEAAVRSVLVDHRRGPPHRRRRRRLTRRGPPCPGRRHPRAILELVDRTGASSVRPQRVAELVAGRLRDRILRGELDDGDLLPKEDELREEFPVSKPSMREALRILETEGLVTVRRGNQGGAVVNRPTAANAAYTMAIVLSGQRVTIADVAASLREVEPACAALCAARGDRHEAVLPLLRQLQDDALAAVDDLVAVTNL